MNNTLIAALDPLTAGAIFDLFPFLFKLKFLFKSAHKELEEATNLVNKFLQTQIDEAKVSLRFLSSHIEGSKNS